MDVWRDEGGPNQKYTDQRNSEGVEISKKAHEARLG